MKNNFKKFAAVVLAVLMCVTAILPVLAAEETCPGNGKTHTVANCDYTVVSEKAATCTADGLVSYKCDTCNDTFVEVLKSSGAHDYEVTTTDPTCTTAGLKTYICKLCNTKKDFELADAIPALGHDYEYTFVDGGDLCTVGAEYYATCKTCKATEGTKETPAVVTKGHAWKLQEITLAPTCKTEGKAVYSCEKCDATLTDVVVATVGDHGSAVTKIADVTLATCTADGTARYHCATCNKTFVAKSTDKGCGQNGWIVYGDAEGQAKPVDPTCTANGILAGDKKCKDCGTIWYQKADGTFTKDIQTENKDNHTSGRTYGAWQTTLEATCTTAGSKSRYCSACGFEKKEAIAKKNHDAKPADSALLGTRQSCTTAEHLYYTCSKCSQQIVVSEKAALGHSYAELETNSKVYVESGEYLTATHVECGKQYKIIKRCTNTGCDAEIYDYQVSPAHTYATVVVLEPTCSATGYSVKACTTCSTKTADGKYTLAGATLDPADKKATVTDEEAADYVKVSDAYGYQKVYNKTDKVATAHVWNAPDATNCAKPATCTEASVYFATCTLCSEQEQVAIPATGHNYAFVKVVPGTGNCIVAAKLEYKCSNANCSVTGGAVEVRDAANTDLATSYAWTGKGHVKDTDTAHGYKAATAATCTAKGQEEFYYCKNAACEYSYSQTTKKPLKDGKESPTLHTFNADTKANFVKHAAVAATCTAAGSVEYYTCPKGNSCATYTSSNAKPYTVLANGTTVDAAGYALKIVVPAKEHASMSAGVVTTATCSSVGYTTKVCTYCDEYVAVSNYVPATEHVLNSNVVTVDNCAQGKYTLQYCTKCDYVEETVIYKPGHRNEANDYISTHCSSYVSDRKCAYCDEVIVADKHTFGAVEYEGNYEIVTCTVCGASDYTSHTHEFTGFAADGEFNHKATCACGKETTVAHGWDAGKVTTAATTEAAGVKTFTCTSCLATRTEEIAKLQAPADTTPIVIEKGCGASVAAMGVALVAVLGTCAVFTAKKKED